MDQQGTARDEWKAARDSVSAATKYAIILFAALIQSWVGMNDRINTYRAALASGRAVQTRAEKALGTLGRRVSGNLLAQRKKGDKERNQELEKLADKAAADPRGYQEALREAPPNLLSDLRFAIEEAERSLPKKQRAALHRFAETRAIAERVPLKLFGLEFAVNGFWAWTVWLLLLSGGVFYLWLSRRALIRRCRAVWQPPQGLHPTRESLPVWVWPLPRNEPWVACLSQGVRGDAAMDPLGVLCAALLVAALALTVPVVRMAVACTRLLWAGENLTAEALIHAACVTLLAGWILGLALTWSSAPESGRPASNHPDAVELMGRRTWLLSSLGCSAVAALYLIGPLNRRVRYSLLGNPRFRVKRRRKSQLRHDRRTFPGPFNAETLDNVHPKELTPFVRAGVRHLLRGVTHQPTAEKKAEVDRLAETQRRYREAFDFTRAAIRLDENLRRPGRVPNLQLYDLLIAIALNGENKELLAEARQMIAAAQVRVPNLSRAPAVHPRRSAAPHSRHSRRKQRGPWLERRQGRLKAFQKDRISSLREDRISSHVANYIHIGRRPL